MIFRSARFVPLLLLLLQMAWVAPRAEAVTDGYFAASGMIQRWQWDPTAGTKGSYSIIGDAASAGGTVHELEVHPDTGDLYSVTEDNMLRHWSWNGQTLVEQAAISAPGGRGFTFGDNGDVYVLSGNGTNPVTQTQFATGQASQLRVFSPDLSTQRLPTANVNGFDIINVGSGEFLVADKNPGDGRIRRLRNTGLTFSDQGTVPFFASELAYNPALGDKYAAGAGYDLETGDGSPTQWMITGEVAGVNGEVNGNGPGVFDANNTGTGFDGGLDLDAGPDGTIFSTQNATPKWLIGWTDRSDFNLPPINSPGSFQGNSDDKGAWVAVDANAEADLADGNAYVVHTASNDLFGGEPSDSGYLRAWDWDAGSTSLSYRGQVPFASPITMEQIAVIPNMDPSPGTPGDYDNDGSVTAADYTVWQDGMGTTYTQADYIVWRDNFGTTAGAASGSQAVPEPASAALLLGFGLLLGAIRRR
ncbi:MAG: hypothetical protein MK161_05600 [Pirellulales bacterium]|nr:hypothetical protein [Pirellulales bacterium]